MNKNRLLEGIRVSDTSEWRCILWKGAKSVYLPHCWSTLAGAEISQLYLSVAGNENVFRFYVAMEDSLLMDEISGLKDIMTYWSDFVEIKGDFFIFVKLIQIAVHQLKDKGHLFYLLLEVPS